jgi:hypothetical protein
MSNIDKLSEILSVEYSTEFDEQRENRVVASFYKYGPAKENYGRGLVDALGSLGNCLKKYQETGNTEYLVDAANYAMFEYMFPQHPKAHFRATDSKESAGIAGISINELKNFEGQEDWP